MAPSVQLGGKETRPYIPLATWDGISVGGYASKVSIAQGESIDFHISTDVPTYTLTIWREGASRQLMTTTTVLSGTRYDCTEGYQPPNGCNWPAATTLTVPANWPSGIYTVDIPTTIKGTQKLIFWLREDNPGSTAKILFMSAFNSYHAYNIYGGKSFYDSTSSNNDYARLVSLNRPFIAGDGVGGFTQEDGFLAWAEGEGYAVEYAANYDLEFIPTLLEAYDVVIIAGHNEYWTWNMRHRLKTFINNGGYFMNLSGNTMWWQVRYDDNGRTLVGYKGDSSDPALNDPAAQQLVSNNTWDYPVFDPEYSIIGAHWRSGGYFESTNDPTFVYNDGYGGFWVQDASHWVFSGTNFVDGDIFGRGYNAESSVLGEEMDGTMFNCDADGQTILGPLANNGTPYNFKILGVAPTSRGEPVDRGYAAMGLYTVDSGGAVFSTNTTGWANALALNSQVQTVTKTVLDHFLTGNVPPEPKSSRDTAYYFYDRFNCVNMHHTGVFSSYTGHKWYEGEEMTLHNYALFEGDAAKAVFTDTCGIDGSGLAMTVSSSNPIKMRAQIKPTWDTTDVLYTRMYLDFSNLTMAEGDEFFLMKMHYDDRVTPPGSAEGQLRIGYNSENFYIRYTGKDPAPLAQTVPGNQPFLLETRWDKINNIMATWVDGVKSERSANLADNDSVNRVELYTTGVEAGTSGTICIDEFAFDNARIGPLPSQLSNVNVAPNYTLQTLPGEQLVFNHILTNTSQITDSFYFILSPGDLNWSSSVSPITSGLLMPNESMVFTISTQVPANAIGATQQTISVLAKSLSDSSAEDEVTEIITVEFVPDISLSRNQTGNAPSGGQLTFTHTVTNSGNYTDNFTLSATPNLPGWTVSPSISETGPLSISQSIRFSVTIQIPISATGNSERTIAVVAQSQLDALTQITNTDIISVAIIRAISLTHNQQALAAPDSQVNFVHNLTNNSNISDSFSISGSSHLNWDILLSTNNITALLPGETGAFTLTIFTPTGVWANTQDTITLTVQSSTNSSLKASNTDIITITNSPGINLSGGYTTTTLTPNEITFEHTLTNTGNATDTFNLSATPNIPTWLTSVSTNTLGPLGPNQSASFSVTVQVPADAFGYTQATIAVMAQSQINSAIQKTVEDQLTVVANSGVLLSAGHNLTSLPGSQLIYIHNISNTGNYTDYFDLVATPDQPDWLVNLATTIIGPLSPNETAWFTITVQIPVDAFGGTQGHINLTATAQSNSATQDTTVDLITLDTIHNVALSPAQSISSPPANTVAFIHSVTNTSNITASFNLSATLNNMGSLNLGTWLVSLSTSSVGPLLPGESRLLTVTVQLPADAVANSQVSLTVVATSQVNASIEVTVTDWITVEPIWGVALSANQNTSTSNGSQVIFTHILTNTANLSDSFNLSATANRLGWSVSTSSNTVGPLNPTQSIAFSITVEVPSNALGNSYEDTTILATSALNNLVQISNTDIISVTPQRGLTLSGDQISQTVPASQVTFNHTLTNSGNITTDFNLSASASPAGWATSLSSQVIPNLSPANAITFSLVVTVPQDVLANQSEIIHIQVHPQNNPSIEASNNNEVRVSPNRDVFLSATQSATILPGGQVTFSHTISNNSNITDSFSLNATPNQTGWQATLSTNTSGPLAPGESTTFTVMITAPQNALGDSQGTIALTAQSQSDDTVEATVNDLVTVGLIQQIALSSGQNITMPEGVPFVSTEHTLTNTSNITDTFDLMLASDSTAFWATTAITNIGPLAPGENALVSLMIYIASNTFGGTSGHISLTAHSQIDNTVENTAINTVTLETVRAVVLSASEAITELPGQQVHFSHTISNSGNISDSFDLSAAIISSDTENWVAIVSPTSTGPLAPASYGLFTVTIDIPGSSTSNHTATITITAISQADSNVQGQLLDQVTVSDSQTGFYGIYLPLILRD